MMISSFLNSMQFTVHQVFVFTVIFACCRLDAQLVEASIAKQQEEQQQHHNNNNEYSQITIYQNNNKNKNKNNYNTNNNNHTNDRGYWDLFENNVKNYKKQRTEQIELQQLQQNNPANGTTTIANNWQMKQLKFADSKELKQYFDDVGTITTIKNDQVNIWQRILWINKSVRWSGGDGMREVMVEQGENNEINQENPEQEIEHEIVNDIMKVADIEDVKASSIEGNALSTKLVRPFDQLGEQLPQLLQLQEYTKFLYFNAEQQTKFHLYTMRQVTEEEAQLSNGPRLLNVLSAAFGIPSESSNFKDMLAANHGIKIELLQLNNATALRQTRFNATQPTRLLIHGWLGGEHANIYRSLIPAYFRLAAGSYNIITVDWGRGAFADYLTASYRVKPVGQLVAKFIDFLQQAAGMKLSQLHVIGFSMGAHVAGICGKHVHSGRLPVIFALDPALPFFHYEQPEERVALTDADYVEVIHTSVGTYGYDRPLGHVDFYVNYGSQQPGCLLYECSHFRAYEIFAEAIVSRELIGVGCMANYWQDMIKNRRCLMNSGKRLRMSADSMTRKQLQRRRGIYYVGTNAKAPFRRAAAKADANDS